MWCCYVKQKILPVIFFFVTTSNAIENGFTSFFSRVFRFLINFVKYMDVFTVIYYYYLWKEIRLNFFLKSLLTNPNNILGEENSDIYGCEEPVQI